MYRISVTTLEKFRRYMASASPYDTEAALIETIKGVFLGNDKTRTGEGFHKLIEEDYTLQQVNGQGLHYLAAGILFTHAQALPAIKFKRDHPAMVHEVSVKKVFQSGSESILISGRVDGLEGMEIRDTKTKYRAIDIEEYHDSFQWRFYLSILGLDTFHYDVFEVLNFQTLPLRPEVEFLDPVSFTCNRYDKMESECQRLLEDFMSYIDNRNFYHLLKTVPENATV